MNRKTARGANLSLRGRLLLAATVVLIAFLGLAGYALDRAFRSSALTALESELQAQIYALLAATEVDRAGRIVLPDALPESRLMTTGSGLYAVVLDAGGAVQWRSPSAVGNDLAGFLPAAPGKSVFRRVAAKPDPVFAFSFGVSWETAPDSALLLTYVIAAEQAGLARQQAAFRRTLALWLGAAALVLLLVQGLILALGLRPLARIEQELDNIERGAQTAVEGRYPEEIARLADRLNAFIRSERSSLERYRNTFGDLAHSLKTPLSVLQGLGEKQQLARSDQEMIREQAGRMGEIVNYQLRRAESAGGSAVVQVTEVRPVLEKVLRSLEKVYAGKQMSAELSVEENALFFGDEGDLFEICGNLLDNACKLCRSRVRIEAETLPAPDAVRPGLLLAIGDDGPGISAAVVEAVTTRGVRGDEKTAGQGIGLALAREIAESYGGVLEIGRSPLGGALVLLRFEPV